AEAVLLHVVVQADLEPEPHLLELVEGRRHAASPRAQVDDKQRLLEPGSPGEDVSCGVENQRVAVEEELVLASDRVTEDEAAPVVPRSRRENLLAPPPPSPPKWSAPEGMEDLPPP